MKRRFFVFFIITILIVSACTTTKNEENKGKTVAQLWLSVEKIHPGSQISLRYSDTSKITAYYYVSVHHKVYGYDLKLEKKDSVWVGSLSVPDSATALAFNFLSSEKKNDDKEKHGYLCYLYNKSGELLPGTRASIAYLKDEHHKLFGVKKDESKILKAIGEDIQKNPEIKENWTSLYAGYLMYKDSVKGKKYIQQELSDFATQEDLSAKEYLILASDYWLLGELKKQDSIQQIAIQKYPKSALSKTNFLNRFMKATSAEEKKAILKEYNTVVGEKSSQKDRMLGQLSLSALRSGKLNEIDGYVKEMSSPTKQAAYLNNAAWKIVQNDTNYSLATQFAKKAIALVKSDKSIEQASFQPKSIQEEQLKMALRSYRDTYAHALQAKGAIKDALKQEEQAVGEGDVPTINEYYVHLLSLSGKVKKIVEIAPSFIKKQKATTKLITNYKKAYIEVNGSDKGWEDNLKRLQLYADKAQLEELKASMLNKDVPEFWVRNNKGDSLSIDDLKGKIKILDLWATWCGPCKKSFPGMEQLVRQYQDNPDVQFYFVNTYQKGSMEARHKVVTQFITSHKYPFNVLYDPNVSGHYNVAEAFGVRGIPTKIVIGPNGKWQFTVVGFDGNTAGMVKEVQLMIELLQHRKTRNNQRGMGFSKPQQWVFSLHLRRPL